jgi:tetratricopeptide (TPR) repeat protein
VLISTFPNDLLRCLEQVVLGPAVTLCPNGHRNTVPGPAVCMDEAGTFGVLYIPPDEIDRADVIEAGLRTTMPMIGVIRRVFEPRGFRRAFIEGLVARHAATLNEFAQIDAPFLWVKQNEERVGYDFMAAGFLLTAGAFPMGRVAREAATAEDLAKPFRPHEELQHRLTAEGSRLAQQDVAKKLAVILLGLIMGLTLDMMEKRSAADLPNRVRLLAPPALLHTDLAEFLAAEVEHYAARVRLGEPGATGVRYCVEAAHALLHHASRSDNQRQKEWTMMLVRYEFERRLDRTDEGLLLPPELLRETIDQGVFWTTIRGFACYMDTEASDYAERVDHLVDTAERIFPGAGRRLLEPAVVFPSSATDAELDRVLTKESLANMLTTAGDDASGIVEILLNGMIRERPALVAPIAQRLSDAVLSLADKQGGEFVVKCTSNITEALNKASQHRLALSIALATRQHLETKEPLTKNLTQPNARFLTELGNCHRYAGEFERALECYESVIAFLPDDLTNYDRRVLEANRAIIYRSLGELEGAKASFHRLQENASDGERIGLIHSEALCWLLQGEVEQAKQLLQRHLPSLVGRSTTDMRVRGYQITLAGILYNAGAKSEAGALYSAVASASDRARDLPMAATARAMELLCKTDDVEHLLAQHGDELRGALDDAFKLGGAPSVAAAIAQLLSNALLAANEYAEAEDVVRRTVDWLAPKRTDSEWQLRLLAAELALARRDGEQAADDIVGAYLALQAHVVTTDPGEDAFSLLRQQEPHLVQLATLIAYAVEQGYFAYAGLRLAADIQNSPVLSSRLLPHAASEQGSNPILGYADQNIAELLAAHDPPAALIQSVELEAGLHLMITRVASDGRPVTTIKSLGLPRQAFEALNRRLAFRMIQLDANCLSLSLDTVTGWPDARDALCSAVQDVPAGTILSVVPGRIESLAFTLALGAQYPLAFVPSLAVGWHLRQRRLRLPSGRKWRPTSVFDFAVWQQGEKPTSVAAIETAASQLRGFATQHHLAYANSLGEGGTADSLIHGLQHCDLVRLACHGRFDIDALGAELLVAFDGLLPPSVMSTARTSQTAQHLLSWRRLAGLCRIAPLILSGACSSGVALRHQGGERLGLERPFFMAGATAFVAPQWPVSMVEIQQLNVAVAQAYISETDKPLGIVVWEQTNSTDGLRLSPLTRTAIGLFGDWL